MAPGSHDTEARAGEVELEEIPAKPFSALPQHPPEPADNAEPKEISAKSASPLPQHPTEPTKIELEQVSARPTSPLQQHPPEPSDSAELENVPLITKSSIDSFLWAQDQCARRIGLTVNDAVTILSFLGTLRRMDYRNTRSNTKIENFQKEAQKFENYLKSLEAIETAVSTALAEVKWWRPGSHGRIEFLKARRKQLGEMTQLSHFLSEFSASAYLLIAIRRDALARADAIQSLEASRVRSVDGSPSLSPSVEFTREETTNKRESGETAYEQAQKSLSLGLNIFYETVNDKLTLPQNRYIVVGWFSRGSTDPKEKILGLEEDVTIFKELQRTIRGIRGWHEYVSLKSLSGFGLYVCDIRQGAHTEVQLTPQNKSTLSSLFHAYQASKHHHDPDIAKEWTRWIEKNFNNSNGRPLEGKYSLELKYQWSPARLTTAVLLPVTFSLVVGLGYMIKTGDVITAWTISIYIVTAAGAIVALLAILGNIKEG